MKKFLVFLVFLSACACSPADIQRARDAAKVLDEVCDQVEAAPALPELAKAKETCAAMRGVAAEAASRVEAPK